MFGIQSWTQCCCIIFCCYSTCLIEPMPPCHMQEATLTIKPKTHNQLWTNDKLESIGLNNGDIGLHILQSRCIHVWFTWLLSIQD